MPSASICLAWKQNINYLVSSFQWIISLSFRSFLYYGVYYNVLKLSVSAVIISQKNSNEDGKLHFFGRFSNLFNVKLNRCTSPKPLYHFFLNVGPPKEDILSGHLLSPIFQSSFLHVTFLHYLALEAAQGPVYVPCLSESSCRSLKSDDQIRDMTTKSVT